MPPTSNDSHAECCILLLRFNIMLAMAAPCCSDCQALAVSGCDLPGQTNLEVHNAELSVQNDQEKLVQIRPSVHNGGVV